MVSRAERTRQVEMVNHLHRDSQQRLRQAYNQLWEWSLAESETHSITHQEEKHESSCLYARVSSRRQEQEGTIQSQIAELKAYILAQSWVLAPEHVYIDDGVSGSQLARPAWIGYEMTPGWAALSG